MVRLALPLLAALLLAPGAWGQDTPELETLGVDDPRPRPTPRSPLEGAMLLRPAALVFASFDDDGDLSITEAELAAGLERVYARLDANGDGRATLLEYAAWSERALGAREAIPGRVAVDTDLDRHVTWREFFTAFRAQADGYGLASDGAVSFQALARPITARELGRGGARPDGQEDANRSPNGRRPFAGDEQADER